MVGNPKGYGAKGSLILIVPDRHILGSDWGGGPGPTVGCGIVPFTILQRFWLCSQNFI